MVFSDYIEQRILYHYFKGRKAPTITKLLQEEQLKANRVGIAKFIKHYKDTGAISRKPGSGRPSKMTAEIKRIVDEQMTRDDETPASPLTSQQGIRHITNDYPSLSYVAWVDISWVCLLSNDTRNERSKEAAVGY